MWLGHLYNVPCGLKSVGGDCTAPTLCGGHLCLLHASKPGAWISANDEQEEEDVSHAVAAAQPASP